MKLPTIPRPLFKLDAVVVVRSSTAAGGGAQTQAVVSSVTQGTYTLPTAVDLQSGAPFDSLAEAILIVPQGTDVKANDLVSVRGFNWLIQKVEDRRNRLRCHLRKVGRTPGFNPPAPGW